MRLTPEEARARLGEQLHGVLCTLHPERGPHPQPVVYAVAGDFVGVPIDRVKPKTSSRLQRESNLDADPRASLLIEHWETEDWTRLWWVRAELRHVSDPPDGVIAELAERLARGVRQYRDQPFHRILVCQVVGLTGWSGASE